MRKLGYQDVIKDLATNSLRTFYLISGEEMFLVGRVLEAIEKAADLGAMVDFNRDVIYGSQFDLARFQESLSMLPMMSPRRLVVLRDAHQLKAKVLEELIEPLSDLEDTVTVVLHFSKVDQRTRFYKALAAKAMFIQLGTPYENEMPQWIQWIAKENGVSFDDQSVAYIHQYVGCGLLETESEIKKIAAYISPKNQATYADVRHVISSVRVHTIFAFTQAVGEKDLVASLYCLAQLLQNGESAVGIVAMVARHLRIIEAVADGQRSGLSTAQLASRAGIAPMFLKEYLAQSSAWSKARPKDALEVVLTTDRALKSSPVSSHIWLENMVLKLCGRGLQAPETFGR
ncbi:MAG: DNA polymerase III subunit delta [Bdellovibrionales bacterium CG10_big_fil_rev_8_21_14_0_10_45_34]|nr:MAG: DNA polymerase III subunit delta [Bdellovibrionales bacterium CG10_big_fil_rev_8_21_14_0_10_45_34]